LFVPLFFGTFEGGLGIEHSGVVEEDIEAAEGFQGLVYGALAVGGEADIGVEEYGVAAILFDVVGYGGSALRASSSDGHLGAFFGEEYRRGFADAGSASGDENDFVVQAH
jgi:hypothetical protein